MRKIRRFWISPDENYIVAPSVQSRVRDADYDDASLTVYSLRQNGLNYAVQQVKDQKDRKNIRDVTNDRILSHSSLKVPNNHLLSDRIHGTSTQQFKVVLSTIKLSSSNSGCMKHTASSSVFDHFHPGLYCVADIVDSLPEQRTSASDVSRPNGSIVFSGKRTMTS